MPTYNLISSTTVGAVSSVSISGISGYSNVRVVVTAKESTGADTRGSIGLGMRINNSSSSLYAFVQNQTREASSVVDYANASAQVYLMNLPGSATTNTRSLSIIDFIDATNRIGGFAQSFSANDSTERRLQFSSFYYNSAVALNSIQIFTQTGNQFAGSVITVYGVN